jgi:hypothetical protein
MTAAIAGVAVAIAAKSAVAVMVLRSIQKPLVDLKKFQFRWACIGSE